MSTVYYPLSHAQTRIYQTEQRYPGTIVFNIGGFLGIVGEVNLSFLKQAIQHVIQKHATLRLQFAIKDGQIVQYMNAGSLPEMVVHDFRQTNDPMDTAYQWAQEEFCQPFTFLHQALYKFALITVAEKHVLVYAKIHHILMDGWSFDLLAKELLSSYSRLCSGRTLHITHEFSYLDYVFTERKYLASPQSLRDRQFWLTRFRAPPQEFLRRERDDIRGKSRVCRLSEERSAFVGTFCKTMHVSLNTVFVSLVLLYLYTVRGRPDITLGIPVFNRRTSREKRIMGQFTSEMPFRTKICPTVSFPEYVSRIHTELKQCYTHQRYPIDLLAKDIGLPQQGIANFFQVCVNYYNVMQFKTFDQLMIEFDELFNHSMLHSFQVNIKYPHNATRIVLFLNYKCIDMTDREVTGFCEVLERIIDRVMHSPHQTIQALC